MEKFNPTDLWLTSVAISHSNSRTTSKAYRWHFQRFCNFTEKTPAQILREYENSTDREFRRKYAQLLRIYIASLHQKQLAPNTIYTATTAVKSFFKHNDLPLAHIPIAQQRIMYHNRDISHKEIQLIINSSRPREQAFYLIMAQGGLRPDTICHLRYKYIREEFEKGLIPCKIHVPAEITKGKFGSHFTFIGEDAVNYLRGYLNTRPNIKDDDYLFIKQGTNEPASAKSLSGLFRRTLISLDEKGLIEVEQKKEGVPRDVRLYNLRKFFRKYGAQAGVEYVNYWMGHKTNYKAPHIPASDEHYFSREDVEFHRKLYTKRAMPHLRIYKETPTEMDKRITELEERNKDLEERLKMTAMDGLSYKESLEQLQKKYQELLEMILELKGIKKKK